VKKKFKNVDPTKPPTYFQSTMENIVNGFDTYLDGITGGKMRRTYPYLITLFFLILFCSVTDLIGLAPGSASLGFTLTLGFITFIGIFVAGIIGEGLFGFLFNKYKNPLEFITQFSPLISLSLRLFGATFAFVMLAAVIPEVFLSFTGQDFIDNIFP
jgi:F-type H+-transporting ATPase subunit a